ncbi:MAG TPA: sigma-70 family RNA polymerase sigma factor [Polyangia bacterium]
MSLPLQATVASFAASAPCSFEVAYRDYAQVAARWARQLGGPTVDVEDVVQEVFLVVSRRLASFRGEARFSTWLFEITRRVVANHRRRQRWRLWRSGSKEDLAHAPSHLRDPHDELERRQTVAIFYQTLDRLPDKYRTVLVLFEIEGLSTHEIADLCHLKQATVRVQLHRARDLFLTRYEQVTKKGKS